MHLKNMIEHDTVTDQTYSVGRNKGRVEQGQRQRKVGEQIRRILSEKLSRHDFHDPTLGSTYAAISFVRVSPDLRHASCYIQEPLGSDVNVLVKKLNNHARKLRTLLAGEVTFKYLPNLRFLVDTTFLESQKIHKLMQLQRFKEDTQDEKDHSSSRQDL